MQHHLDGVCCHCVVGLSYYVSTDLKVFTEIYHVILQKITQAQVKCISKLIGYPKFFVIGEVLDTMVSDRCTIVLFIQVVVP